MMNEEEYLNQIELLKQALKFYADERNYNGPMGTIAPIDSDEQGSQARFALEQIKKLEEANQKMEEDYYKIISEAISEVENNSIDIPNMIKTIKNINDNNI